MRHFVVYIPIIAMLAIVFSVSKQKPYWKLTKEEKKKQKPLIIVGFILLLLGLAALIWVTRLPEWSFMD